MKNPIVIIILAVVAWFILKPKKAATATSSNSLFGGAGGVYEGSMLRYPSDSYSDSTVYSSSDGTADSSSDGITSDGTITAPTIPTVKTGDGGISLAVAPFTFSRSKSAFKWRNSQK